MNISKDHKIILFGDSISRGIITTESKLQTIEENVVSLISKELGIEIENISSYGQTITRLQNKGTIDEFIKKTKSENTTNQIAVIAIGGNDSDFDWTEVAKAPLSAHSSKTPLDKFETILSDYVHKLKECNCQVVLVTIPPIDSQRFFDNVISKKTDKNAILKFFDNDITNISRHQECFNLAIVKCAMRENCILLDIRSDFLVQRNFLRYMCDDGIHPNKLGHQLMKKTILSAVNMTS